MVLFKERLKELRLEKNLRQLDIANALGVAQRSISNWEAGLREPDFEMLEKITEYFGVSADFLLGFKDN